MREPEDAPVLVVDDADDSSSGAGTNFSDSGVECGSSETLDEVLPDEATAAEILKLIEYYLSDENILKDPFLLKHVRRNKEGYVNVKLLASFRKVRTLCRGWKAVAHSLARSQVLALNADGTKVRRMSPLPDQDEGPTSSRSVLARGLDRPSVEAVSEMFSSCGDIALVRILKPGGQVPAEVRPLLAKNPSIQKEVCALVEFEDCVSARKALERDLEVQVLPLVKKSEDSPKKKKKNRRGSDKGGGNELKPRHVRSGSMSSQSSDYLSSSPGSGFFQGEGAKYPRRHSYNPPSRPHSPFARHSGPLQDPPEGSMSPWRRRRQILMMQSDSSLHVSSGQQQSSSPVMLSVRPIRMPKGPDGTRGFVARTMLPSTAE